jgi:CMP-N-acetylneuraminic acid synthetase
MTSFEKIESFTAILPLKFNSERIPGKNFREFMGAPLYQHMLNKLISIGMISRVVVNTDAPMDLFQDYIGQQKVEISVRPEHLMGDLISMNSIIGYEVNRLQHHHYFMTHTTNPLISVATINAMLNTYLNLPSDFDSVFGASKLYGRFLDKDGEPLNHNPSMLARTQDLDPVFLDNSCGYVFSKKSFMSTLARIGSSPVRFETPKLESIDIDEEEDWVLAEIVAKSNVLDV